MPSHTLHASDATIVVLPVSKKIMAFEDNIDNVEQNAKNTFADGKKNVKDAWADTKAAAEKAGNEMEAEEEKL